MAAIVKLDRAVAACRSPEREALAAAIARRDAAREALERVAEARRRAPEVYLANRKVDDAQAALEAAEAAEPERLVSELLTGSRVPSPVDAALEALAEAEAERDRARQVRDVLARREEMAVAELQIAERHLAPAIAAVVASEPALPELFKQYDAAKARLADVCRAIRALPSEAYPANRRPFSFFFDELPDLGFAAPWRAAVLALHDDADAALPAVTT